MPTITRAATSLNEASNGSNNGAALPRGMTNTISIYRGGVALNAIIAWLKRL